MKINMYVGIGLSGLFFACHSLSAATIQCPQAVKTRQVIDGKMKGWDTFVNQENVINNLNGITFYDHHPKENASLAPDNEGTVGKKLMWTFGGSEIWLACGYANTTVQLLQKLPAGIKTCAVSYEANFTTVLAIDCK